MPHTTIISPDEVAAHLADDGWLIVDSRFVLTQPAAGRTEYERAHIAGAVYAHLDDDLSGPIVPGTTGRHPLPSVDAAAATFARLGIGDGTQVVVYDDQNGLVAARLWWMLRWLGHSAVAVLDGGWQRWRDEGRPTQGGVETRAAATFTAHPRPELIVDTAEVERVREDPGFRVMDARAGARYRGETEPIDPVAGHIPGAISAPLTDNLDADGSWLPPEQLRERYTQLMGDVPPEATIMYCGSGVSAGHNLLALQHAGLGEARLYAGSWSEWITDPSRPIATGDSDTPTQRS